MCVMRAHVDAQDWSQGDACEACRWQLDLRSDEARRAATKKMDSNAMVSDTTGRLEIRWETDPETRRSTLVWKVDGWKASQERGLLSSEGSRIHYEIASTRCKFDL